MEGELSGLLADPSAPFIPKLSAQLCGFFFPLPCLLPLLPPPTPWLPPPLVPLEVEGVGDGPLDSCLLSPPLLRLGVWVLGLAPVSVLVLMSVDWNITSATIRTSSSSPPSSFVLSLGVGASSLVSSSFTLSCLGGGFLAEPGLPPGGPLLVIPLPLVLVPGWW